MRTLSVHVFLLAAVLTAGSAQAQNTSALYREASIFTHSATEPVTPAELDSTVASAAGLPLPRYGPWVGVTKWVTLGSSVGFGILGAVMHLKANEDFARLRLICDANAQACREFNDDGSYQIPALENMYQNVVHKDNVARFSWLVAQVSFGASVVLFIVDFQRSPGPGDIPYEPPGEEQNRLQLSVLPGEITLRYYLD